MRKIFFLLILLPFPVLAFDACAPEAVANYHPISQQAVRALFFKIEKCNTPPSYIFGTMHTDDPAFNRRVNLILQTITATRTAYFEILTDKSSSIKAASYMRLPQGKTLQEIIGNELFGKVATAMQQRGLAPQITNSLTPWAVAIMIQMPPNKADGMVIDDKLQTLTFQKGMAVKALEEIDEHFHIFTGLPLDKQVEMLRESLVDQQTADDINRQLEQAYSAQDLQQIDKLGKISFAEVSDANLRNYLETELLTRRNKIMAERLSQPLAMGNVFVAVGALHLPGDNGLLHEIEGKGYFLTPLPIDEAVH